MNIGARVGWPVREPSDRQREVLERDLGFDDGGRYALVAVSGFAITHDGTDTFGTVFSLIDTDTGDELEQSRAVSATEARAERVGWIARVRHLNGRDDPYAPVA